MLNTLRNNSLARSFPRLGKAPRSLARPGRAPRRLHAARCISQENDAIKIAVYPQIEIPNKVYSAICGFILVGELGLVDAAFSGDWSRIGVLTTGQELQLQQAVYAIISIHAVEAVIAVCIAKSKGVKGVQLAAVALKAFSFGALEINKVAQLKPLQ